MRSKGKRHWWRGGDGDGGDIGGGGDGGKYFEQLEGIDGFGLLFGLVQLGFDLGQSNLAGLGLNFLNINQA